MRTRPVTPTPPNYDVTPRWEEPYTPPTASRWKLALAGIVFLCEFMGLHLQQLTLRPSHWITVGATHLGRQSRFLGTVLAVISQQVAELPRKLLRLIGDWLWPFFIKIWSTFGALFGATLGALWLTVTSFLAGYVEISAAQWSTLVSTLLVVIPCTAVLAVIFEVVGMKREIPYIRTSWVMTKLFANPVYDVSWTLSVAYTQVVHVVSHFTSFIARFLNWLAPWIEPYLELFTTGMQTVAKSVVRVFEAPIRGLIDGCYYVVARVTAAKRWWMGFLGLALVTVTLKYTVLALWG